MRYIIDADPRLELDKPYELIAAPEIVYFVGEINEESAAMFRRDLEVAEHNAAACDQEILPVCIDSGGGCLYSLMGMVDAMNACNITLATVVEAKAMSAAAVLVSCGDKDHRYMGPNATIMLHSTSGGSSGTVASLEADIEEVKRLDRMTDELLSKNCGKKKNFFGLEAKKHGPEWYINPKEAKSLGLISHIGIPVLRTKITFSHSLSMK